MDSVGPYRTRLCSRHPYVAHEGAAEAGKAKRTSEIAETAAMVTKTAHRQLDDLAMLSIAKRTKQSDSGNSPDLWSAEPWLRD